LTIPSRSSPSEAIARVDGWPSTFPSDVVEIPRWEEEVRVTTLLDHLGRRLQRYDEKHLAQ